MKKILLIDNYDSFTYNLAHVLEEHPEVELNVLRNTEIPENISETYDGLMLSPGPGIPKEAGELMKCIQDNLDKLPVLGICLGHQAIAESLGGKLLNTAKVYHGLSATINNHKNNAGILKNMGPQFEAGRYHSWVVNHENFPADLEITADIEDGTIMAFQHRSLPVFGVQFHPESILTPQGKTIIFNWVNDITKK